MSLYYSEHALLFNLQGERFTDETQGDHLTTMALLEQAESRGLLVADARVFRDWVVGSYVEGAVAVDKFGLASKRAAASDSPRTSTNWRTSPRNGGIARGRP
ncbi:hypothetical protein [Streptomyces sp. F001]|uniref:hypothetical protein n=1 Tax=Streptomyces sp. F001 TaxID=1510026 RepID=UPI001F118159|nr:hypothetical protein [Streptomyces sp. F001]